MSSPHLALRSCDRDLGGGGWLRNRALVRLAVTLVGFGLTLLLLLSPVWAGGISSLTAALRRETSTLATLESLTEWVTRTEQELEEARQRRGEVEHQMTEAERRVKALHERSVQRRQHVQQRVRSIYKMSRGGGMVRLLLEAASGEDLATRVSAAALILRRDARELALYQQELARLALEQRALAEKRAQQRQVVERLEAKHSELRGARANQVKLLRRLQASRRLQHQLAEELDQQQRALLRRVGEITWRLQVAGGFAARKGKLGRPVAGPIIGVFGGLALSSGELSADRASDEERPRSHHRVEILRHGLTFRPRGRSPVGAVAPGIVRLAGSLRGYGNVVLVEHSDGYYTLYGFLSQVQVEDGAEVDKGTVLGRAGFDPLTGRAAMYFELRHGAQALDPAVWLRR
jgi:septal ring factor EnvC (AmiA/AmiB activator)